VYYADEAFVAATMVTGEAAARTQRQRWEGGRMALLRSKTWPLVKATMRWDDGEVCLDLLIDLWVLPLSVVAANIVVLSTLAALAMLWLPAMQIWLGLGLGCGLCIGLYVLRGWQLSGVGLRGLLDLLRAPFFVLWKLLLMRCARDSSEWVRTQRERP
jgi:hypothetical protein